MKSFAYLQAENFAAAAKALRDGKNCVVKGAGTDLLDLLKERIVEPDEVVSLLKAKRGEKRGELSALATLAEVAHDAWIEVDFPALKTAAGEAATPQVRNVATVGGNLCQHTRCWYFRSKDFDCFKRDGQSCSAMKEGAHNRYHAGPRSDPDKSRTLQMKPRQKMGRIIARKRITHHRDMTKQFGKPKGPGVERPNKFLG